MSVGGTINDCNGAVHSMHVAVVTSVRTGGADIGATMRTEASSDVDISADAAAARPIDPPQFLACSTATETPGRWSPPCESRQSSVWTGTILLRSRHFRVPHAPLKFA
jgi:hypothetical protein